MNPQCDFCIVKRGCPIACEYGSILCAMRRIRSGQTKDEVTGEPGAASLKELRDLKAENTRLRAERDALKKALHGRCWACAHGAPHPSNPTGRLPRCPYLGEGITAAMERKDCPHWEWKAQQLVEEESHAQT